MSKHWYDQEADDRDVPRNHRAVYKEALIGNGYKKPINAMCLECQGWVDNVQDAIAFCACRGCPLYRVRPYQNRNLYDG